MKAVTAMVPQRCPLLLLVVLLTSPRIDAQELTISRVQPGANRVEVGARPGVQVRFTLSTAAKVSLQIFDGRDLLIHEIDSAQLLSAGEHTMRWDLRDQSGKSVPAEAYTYVLEATAANGQTSRYDLADATGGTAVTARDVKWNPEDKQLSYVLDRPARVNIRIGLQDGGPLLRTLVDWVVRPAGLNVERWDGKDISGVLDLTRHPKLAISVEGFALPENTIIVGSPQNKVLLISQDSLKKKEQRKAVSAPKHMYAHAQQPLESRGDFSISLQLPGSLGKSAAGVPIVSTPIPVRLDVNAIDRERALARRFEPVFFVDGQFAFENEVGFIPMTWNFDPSALNEGEHFLTVNLRGYEGNFGMTTVKILIQRPTAGVSKW